MMSNHIVRVSENPYGLQRYYVTNFEVIRPKNDNVEYRDGWVKTTSSSDLAKELGSRGATFFYELHGSIDGISFAASLFKITVTLKAALDWSSVETALFDVITRIYGEFRVEREPWITRAAYWLRRSVIEPLTPPKK